MKRFRYRAATTWMGRHLAFRNIPRTGLESMVVVALVSELYGVDPKIVARDVERSRREAGEPGFERRRHERRS